MAFGSATPKVWPVPPDWPGGMSETLAWATEPLRSSATAASHHRGYRLGPRRAYSFDVLAWGAEHRAVEMLLAGYRDVWLLPIFPDVQWLSSTVAAGADTIPCVTAGRDFVAGGKALLYRAVNAWEIVDVDSVESDHIALGGVTSGTFGVGSRLYPLRRAVHRDGAEARMRNDRVSRRTLSFDLIEPSDWPALDAGTEYLGHRVLDERPDESDDPTSSFAGVRDTVDYGAGFPVVSDLPRITLRSQRDSWRLVGRSQQAWFRSLLYTLRGRQRPVWVPSWSSDLQPMASIPGGGTVLSVEWCGYTLFGLGKPNRRDVRIELVDGTVYHRRINNAVEAGETESLTLSASLDPASITPDRVRQISIMALCTLASDSTEIKHQTDVDGYATSTTGWEAVVPDV